MAFEFLKTNYIDTTTQLTIVGNGSTTVENLLIPDPVFQYVTTGFNDDNTTASITISFDETLSVDRIALIEHNLKDFTIFYNGATANTFALTSTAATTTADFSSNSETSMYLRCTPVDCTSVTLEMSKTMAADAEKAIGYLVVTGKHFKFDRDPSAKDYKPKIDSIEVEHRLSDGGSRIHQINTKWMASIKLANITKEFRDQLKSVYDLHSSFMFCPFGTATGWDGILFDCVWPGDFDFYRYSDNAVQAGFVGTINLKETS